jgi:hypothetical protein
VVGGENAFRTYRFFQNAGSYSSSTSTVMGTSRVGEAREMALEMLNRSG